MAIYDEDPDRIYYDEKVTYEEPLYEFFTCDYFDRYYSSTFVDDSLMLVGDITVSEDSSKLSPWKEVTTFCYNGTTYTGSLKSFSQADFANFNDANIVIIYGEEDNRYLQTLLLNALQNKAEVIFISENPSLINQYAKKFKSIIPILDSSEDNHLSAKKQLINYFIEQYKISRENRI